MLHLAASSATRRTFLDSIKSSPIISVLQSLKCEPFKSNILYQQHGGYINMLLYIAIPLSKWILLAPLSSISITLLGSSDLMHRDLYTLHNRVAKFAMKSIYWRLLLLEVGIIDQLIYHKLLSYIWSASWIIAITVASKILIVAFIDYLHPTECQQVHDLANSLFRAVSHP